MPASHSLSATLLGTLLRTGAFALTSAAALAAAGTLTALAPEPDPVPRRWQLEIQPGDLRVAMVDVKDPATGTTTPKSFVYMTYTVTNNSGQDLLFAPMFELSDGSGKVIRYALQQLEAADVLMRLSDKRNKSYQSVPDKKAKLLPRIITPEGHKELNEIAKSVFLKSYGSN